MGQLILCRTKKAEHPFFIGTAKLNIYSLEELFYYLFHAAFVDKRDLICEEFIYWVRDELSMPDTSGELYESYVAAKGLMDFISILESHCGYLTENELKRLNINLNRFDHMSPVELGKQSADDLLRKGKYKAAISAYRSLLGTHLLGAGDDVVIGDIYHNMGVCYSRFFDFDEANRCFIKAYRANHRVESLNEAVDCAVVSGDKQMLENISTIFNTSFSGIEREVKRATAVHTDSLSKAKESAPDDIEDYYRKYLLSCED